MKIRSFVVAIVFPLSLLAQTKLSQEQIIEDYTIFKNILTTGHPSLYEYTTKENWDSIFNHFEKKELKQLTNSDGLFRSISALAEHVKDGHLIVHYPKMDSIPKMFPLLLKIIDGKLYADTDEFKIPAGSQIVTIDGENCDQLINRMLKYAPSDGYNLTKKHRQIETEFGILLYYELGEKSTYEVVYLTPDNQSKTTTIESQDFEQIGKRHALRNSHFAAYHGDSDRAKYFQTWVSEKWPRYHYIDSINTAVLTVPSFGLDPTEFKSRLVNLFKKIRKKKTDNLILDIRSNNGGYRINTIHLFSFLTEKPFRQRISESVITSHLPEGKYLLDTVSDYRQFFSNYFASAKKENGRWILQKDHAIEEMKPFRKPFKGNVFVLIGGRTFSAGSAFALNAKNDANITLIGEEAGGGYYFHTGQYPVLYELPNSRIILRMSFVKINHYVTDNTIAKGRGVLPDNIVHLTVQDLIESKDSQLDYVIKCIQKLK
ncbi:hypothetical protein D1164_11870 [Mariniphaga sediminis]|uniref:Tail specific protease domain-containing protein n=1 Tax=Mariniphaga sediminis TaxID=1628158 RepID=A0A399D3N7_9BACT|nr:S41 family peptidase [Mariniphaga sediminis]RIH65272.1 hypothetical protein D1164_11870 [Mariniphaga sediminis]